MLIRVTLTVVHLIVIIVVVEIVLEYVLVQLHLKLKNVLRVRQQQAQISIMELVVHHSEKAEVVLEVKRDHVDAVSKITVSLVIHQVLIQLADNYVILNHGGNLSNKTMQNMLYVGLVLDQMSVVSLYHVITQSLVILFAILDVLNIGGGRVSNIYNRLVVILHHVVVYQVVLNVVGSVVDVI